MKRLVLLGVLGLYICIFFSGCHTLDMLSKVRTGGVTLIDAWESIKADDQDFQEAFW
ncbi:hypothetical protein ACFL2J_05840 [Candidatus Omnitrophota bacterium]